MNLNYSITTIAKQMNARIIGSSNLLVRNVSIDSRSPLVDSETLFFALQGKNNDGHQFTEHFIISGGKMVVVEQEQKQLKCTQLVVEDTLKALQVLATYHRSQFNIPVIGITGSNGKTTVKEWLYHVLKKDFRIIRSPKSYNSQIGVPLSILEMTEKHELAIIEAGISMPNEMVKLEKIIQPTIGVYTGIGDAHQEHFKSLKEKEANKLMLFKNVDKPFSIKEIDPKIEIPFHDEASVFNANLVKSVALSLKVDDIELEESLKTLPFISMRMERMEGTNENILINDTYSFDEKGLEIALQSMNLETGIKKKILIVAPNSSYEPGVFFRTIVEANHIDEVIWISTIAFPIKIETKVRCFKSVEEFIQAAVNFEKSMLLFSGARQMRLEKSIPFYQLKKHITRLEIDLKAIRKNLDFYKSKLNKKEKILAMVKAQSYGSGSIEMSKFLANEGVDALGVAYADEGVLLRNKGINLPILVLNPENGAFDNIIDNNLEPSIYGHNILNQLLHQIILRGRKRIPIHIKVDTGMHRLGFLEHELPELISTLNTQPEVYVKAVFSHLATADDLNENEFTNTQIHKFNKMCDEIEAGIGYSFIKHLSNTASIINHPAAHFDMVRIGIGLFGISNSKSLPLKNALFFKSQISQIKWVPKGDSIGYNRDFKADKRIKIGIVPVGYADGLSRQLSNGVWHIKVNEDLVPIIGAICMDMCMVDLSKCNCQEGDIVEIFGWGQSLKQMALKLNTIPYEVISSISSRVHRVYID
ncbi:MAG: alanine racemase [Crocinitomicaceae bacterium]